MFASLDFPLVLDLNSESSVWSGSRWNENHCDHVCASHVVHVHAVQYCTVVCNSRQMFGISAPLTFAALPSTCCLFLRTECLNTRFEFVSPPPPPPPLFFASSVLYWTKKTPTFFLTKGKILIKTRATWKMGKGEVGVGRRRKRGPPKTKEVERDSSSTVRNR